MTKTTFILSILFSLNGSWTALQRRCGHLVQILSWTQQVVLTRGGIDLRDVLDIVHDIGRHVVGVAQLAFDEDEDGGHHGGSVLWFEGASSGRRRDG